MKFEIAVKLFSNFDRRLNLKIDLANNSVTPDDITIAKIESSLRGDVFWMAAVVNLVEMILKVRIII